MRTTEPQARPSTAERLTTVASVRTQGSPVSTKATFVIEDRVPGVKQTYLRPYNAPKMAAKSEQSVIDQTIRNETQP